MKEQKLTWRARGRLWFRIGIRLVLLLAVLTGVIGLLLVLRPAEGAQVMVMLMGASLLLDGALNLSVALCAVKVVDHQRPDVIETDDFEIE